MIDETRLKEIEERCEKATGIRGADITLDDATCNFIAASRQDVPELVAYVRDLERALELASPYPEPEYRRKYREEMLSYVESEKRLGVKYD